MIGLDTNVVIRYLVQDDESQSAIATDLIENSLSTEAPGYVNHITLCEIVWVLKRCYGVAKPEISEIIHGLLATKQIVVENVGVAWRALRAFENKSSDFCDALIGQSNLEVGCEHTATFDKNAAGLPGFTLLGKGGF